MAIMSSANYGGLQSSRVRVPSQRLSEPALTPPCLISRRNQNTSPNAVLRRFLNQRVLMPSLLTMPDFLVRPLSTLFGQVQCPLTLYQVIVFSPSNTARPPSDGHIERIPPLGVKRQIARPVRSIATIDSSHWK